MVFWDCLWMIGLFHSLWSYWIRQSQSDKTVFAFGRSPPIALFYSFVFYSANGHFCCGVHATSIWISDEAGYRWRSSSFFHWNFDSFLRIEFWNSSQAETRKPSTGSDLNVLTWLREFSSCSCLTALPGPAWVLLSKTFKPFRPTQ